MIMALVLFVAECFINKFLKKNSLKFAKNEKFSTLIESLIECRMKMKFLSDDKIESQLNDIINEIGKYKSSWTQTKRRYVLYKFLDPERLSVRDL